MSASIIIDKNPQTKPKASVKQKRGSRLSLWLSKLPKSIPQIDPLIAKRVRAEIANPYSTSESLASIIQHDPVLCLKLFLKGGDQLKTRDGDIQGLTHLIGLLGLNQISHVIDMDASMTIAEVPDLQGQQALVTTSIFAAHLANQLLPQKHGTRGERFFLPSLLFHAPLWLMWSAAPKLMSYGQIQASKKQQPLELTCQKNLGFPLRSLWAKTESFLPLADTTLKALKTDPHQDLRFWAKALRMPASKFKEWLSADKQAKHYFASVETGIYLINHYALAIYLDWNGKHIQRWANLLAKHLDMTVADLMEATAQVATHMPNVSDAQRQQSALYRLRGLHKKFADDKKVNQTDIIEHYLALLRRTDQLNQCLQLGLEALVEGTRVQHCIILKFSNYRLKVPLSYGFESKAIESIDIDFNDCGKLLRGLLKQAPALSINASQLLRIEEQLPTILTQHWLPKPCGLMSLFYESEPYAIIICDHKNWNEQRQQQFKTIGKQLTKTLKQCKDIG